MATEQKPYTLARLMCTLLALVVEGAAMVVGTTWFVLHSHHGIGLAYLFAALIGLLSVALGLLQIHYYRQENHL